MNEATDTWQAHDGSMGWLGRLLRTWLDSVVVRLRGAPEPLADTSEELPAHRGPVFAGVVPIGLVCKIGTDFESDGPTLEPVAAWTPTLGSSLGLSRSRLAITLPHQSAW